VIRAFCTPDELAEALAQEVAAALTARLAQDGAAALAVSGGSTPLRFFRALAARALDWDKITVTLVDDRWVGEDSPRSNAGLVRAHLLQGPAAAARFVPLVNDAATPEAGRAAVEAALREIRLPLAAAVLGMGADGHTASFFPGGDRLAQALAPAQGEWVETMRAPAAIEPRITLTLPLLLAAGFLALHIEGAAKRAVLEEALRPGPVAELPVRAVLAREPQHVVIWSP
jgi:6-phosphogluconolactonase